MQEKQKLHHGVRIYDLRQDHNLSQEQLAEKIGVSKATVQRWEKGENIYSDSLLKLSALFKKSIDWILTGYGTENLLFGVNTLLTNESVNVFINNSDISYSMNYLTENHCEYLVSSIVSFLLLSENQAQLSDNELPGDRKTADGVNLGMLLGDIMKAREAIIRARK